MADGCGLFFTGESAFKKHFTKVGHVHPSEVGMVEREHRGGPVWGLPGENPQFSRIALASPQEAS